jgi:putative tryptophan/tyrosine transport system substrate-binding protein
MRRRQFLTLVGGAAADWPILAAAQQPRMPRIGALLASEQGDQDLQARVAGLRKGHEELGWTDGRNVRVDYRFGEGRSDRFQSLAKELVALQPDVIIAQSPPVVVAVQRETDAIPIVFLDVFDPVELGFVTSLARPGGNLTGLLSFEESIGGKWLAMLKDISPGLARAALVGNPKTTAFDHYRRGVAAPAVGVEVVPVNVETAGDIERAIESFAQQSNGGLIFPPDSTIILHRDLVVALAARYRLPAIYPFRSFVAAGGLMSYGIDFVFEYRQAASYVDRILHGAKPTDIPVQTPTKFETILNLKTAKALGLTVPPAFLIAADEVIE